MQKKAQTLKHQAGMTLVEILVALLILGFVLIAIFPLVTQSLHVTNLSNTIAAHLFGDQENIEIVAATNGGVYFADGTFLPNKYFNVVFGSNVKPVPGMTIRKDKLVRFLGSIPYLEGFEIYEGYTEEEAVITIVGKNSTSFIDTTHTVLTITNKNGQSAPIVPNSYQIIDKNTAQFTIPTDSSRYTNFESPYFVYLTTGNEKISALLQVHLPRAVVAKKNHNLLIASSPVPADWVDGSGDSNWVEKSTSTEISHDFHKIIFSGSKEQESYYIAVGEKASIYRWDYGEKWRKLSLPLSNDEQDASLNGIIRAGDGYIVVGDEGIVLLSTDDGLTWKRMPSGTSANLRAITFFNDKNQYVCVGDRGVILTSPNGKTWSRMNTYPRLAKEVDILNDKNAVEFSGKGEYLKTALAPVTGGTSRTVFMVVKPNTAANTLLSWGSPLNSITDEFFSFLMDDNGKLSVEKDESNVFTSNLKIPSDTNDAPSLVICRSDSADFNSYRLYMNGEKYEQSSISKPIDTPDTFPAQLGSDPLTRFTDPLPFEGLVAEVIIFDSAVSDTRGEPDPPEPNKSYASDMDLIRKYLSDKYGLGITELDDTQLNDLYYPGTDTTLDEENIFENPDILTESLVANYSDAQDHLKLWLDASALDLADKAQVQFWEDQSGDYNGTDDYNHARGAALNAVAVNDKGELIAGGEHRNLIVYDKNVPDLIQEDNMSGHLDLIVQYSVDDMIFAQNRFINLLNDDLSSSGKSYIATFNRNDASANDRFSWNYNLNDLFYYDTGKTLVVPGNHGTILYSIKNDGVNWEESDSATTDDLLAACLR